MKLKIYFQTISPESASHGDFSEQGEHDEKTFENVLEAVEYLQNNGFCEASSSCFHKSIWYQTTDPEQNYKTGEETYYTAHLEGFSESEELEVYKRTIGED